MRANRYYCRDRRPRRSACMAYCHTLVYLVCSHSLNASFDSREVPSAGEAEGLSGTNFLRGTLLYPEGKGGSAEKEKLAKSIKNLIIFMHLPKN